MPAQTSMLHVRVDDQLKIKAADILASSFLSVNVCFSCLYRREKARDASGVVASERLFS